MKKWIFAVLVLCALFSFAACDKEDKVTIYIPEKMTITAGEGGETVTATYTFEEGWEAKESFTATLKIAGLPGMEDAPFVKMTYGNRTAEMEQTGTLRTTTVYNEKGLVISYTSEATGSGINLRTETTTTYDDRGRKLSEESRTRYNDQETPAVTTVYTYTDTDTGSEGRSESGTVLTYDKSDRMVCMTTTLYGEEVSRTENTYDEVGNLICTQTFAEGKLVTKTETTYRAVEVSKETADRLPNFKRGK